MTSASTAIAIFAAGCEDDSKCEGAECLFDFDATRPDLSVDGARDAFASPDVETKEDAAPSDGSTPDSDESDASSADADVGGPDATAGGPDANDGGPRAIATPAFPWSIAVGGGFAYATTMGDVVKVPVGGGASSTIQQGGAIELLTADETNLYFTTLTGTVYKRPHGGTTNIPISDMAVALQVRGLVVHANHVYWTEFANGGTVHRVAIDGSTLAGESVSPGLVLPNGVAFDNESTYVADSHGTVPNAGRIVRLNPDGGAPIEIATNRTGASKLVVGGNRLYWYDNGGGSGPVVSTALPNGGSIATHANTAVDPALVTDGDVFYYGNASGGIVKINVSASSIQTLYPTSQTGTVYGLVVAGNSLFWTDYSGGRLMTAPK
ncbi:MAG TPA: hypothetical protein VM580_05315 [Labilithrix sp.]|nr:hypothetical protein [Labilithrix sp.]